MGPHVCIVLSSLMKSHVFLTTILGTDPFGYLGTMHGTGQHGKLWCLRTELGTENSVLETRDRGWYWGSLSLREKSREGLGSRT